MAFVGGRRRMVVVGLFCRVCVLMVVMCCLVLLYWLVDVFLLVDCFFVFLILGCETLVVCY